MRKLEQLLRETDHKGYPAYKQLKGRYHFPAFELSIDHVQGDPFAAPSSVSLRIAPGDHGIPKEYYETPHRRIMLQDYLLRSFGRELAKYDHRAKGSGKSGTLSVSRCRQEVLERSALQIDPASGLLTLRLYAGFPAAGRTTLSMELKKMLMEYIPDCAARCLRYAAISKPALLKWIRLSDDQQSIRSQLSEQGLVAFVANGANLPRKSGVDDTPMKGSVPFTSPKENEITLTLPEGRTITGMGIRKGITLIVGGGYHGKSTLLKALERGVYNHIPEDGREYVITESTAMKIRSEDGRSVKQLDISPFIRNLPNNKDTTCFSTEDASGSTSQAANTVEAVLSGSKTLLIDEDTCATNFMVRDELMQKVVLQSQEPIVPFLHRMRQLYDTKGISTILVAGSCGAYFAVSDHILQMKEYEPSDITKKAKEAAEEFADVHAGKTEASDYDARNTERNGAAAPPDELKDWQDKRIPLANKNVTESKKVKVKGAGTDAVILNHESVELRFVEQVVDSEQTNLLGTMLRFLEENRFNGKTPLTDCVNSVYQAYSSQSFGAVTPGHAVPGNLAEVRVQELWAMVNRYRGLKL
ncbi:MAG: ABC-ATPase domain-containing protein [Lachnospiraceae bacterium]|nr:ABC-ATPase domain-containing protein [Lachnospiraceae bacterium]